MTAGLDRRDRQTALLLVIAGTIVQLPALWWGLPGGKAITNAMRILDGDLPYRDFWTMYAPGHFYLLAGLFKLLGVHAWVAGLGAQVCIAIDAALLFTLTRRAGLSRRLALAAGGAFLIMQWGHHEVTAYETVLVFLLLGLNRIVCYIRGEGVGHLIGAGLLFGVGAWFKHDVACYVTIGTVAGLTLAWILLRGRRPAAWIPPAPMVARVAGGAVIGVLPMVLYLAGTAAPDAWRDLIVFPATDFRVVRGESYPPLLPAWGTIGAWARDPLDPGQIRSVAQHLARWLQANMPQLAFVGAVMILGRQRRRLAPIPIAIGVLALATMPLFWASAHVQQNTNFHSLWIYSVMLLTMVWAGGALRPAAATTLAIGFAIYTGSFFVPPALDVAEIAYFWRDRATLEFPIVKGVRVPGVRYRFQQPIVSFIREHVPESERIYVGLMRHDAVVISNPIFYYLADRRIASRYNELHPGIVDREEVQREIIADLERLHVRCAVLWDFGWPKPYMDSILAARQRQIPALGATTLDEYFRREFQEVGRFHEYVLVWRKGGPIPPPPRPVAR
jgi:hypothetical protein